MKKSKSMIILFLLPAIVIFTIIFVYPIIRTLIMSLFYVDNVTAPLSQWNFVGVSNYIKLFSTKLFKQSLWNLFRIWLYGGAAVMTLGLLFAVILNSGIRYKSFFRSAIYLPNVVSAVALATMWLQFVYNNRFGLLTTTFKNFGWDSLAAIQWTDTEHKFYALLIAYCFGMVGYHMLIFSSGIEKIPKDYYEAATIDGANRVSQFKHITWPLLRNVLKTNITMWSITSVGFFVWSQLFSSVTADTQTITPMVYLYLLIFGTGNTVTERNAGLGAAVGVLLSIFVVVAFIITSKALRDDDLEY